ncbi:MAG: hypothetical protein JSV44_03015, partial [Candidatus Zixiibacteriota bacterium]
MKQPVTMWIMLAVICLTCPPDSIFGQDQTTPVISYQGRLTDADGNAVTDGEYDFTFSIYDDSTTGSMLWTETHLDVPITNGLFHVLLGSTDFIVDSVWAHVEGGDGGIPVPVYLGITVDGEEIQPRARLGASPYSYVSRRIRGDIFTSPGRIVIDYPGGLLTASDLHVTGDNGGSVSQVLQSPSGNDIIYMVNFLTDTSMADLLIARVDTLVDDTISKIAQTIDTGGAMISLGVQDDRFMGLRCNKKKTAFEAIHTNELGDTAGMIVQSVDSGWGATVELKAGDRQFMGLRCDKKKTAFEAVHTDELGDTTGMIVQSVDSSWGATVELKAGDRQFMG